MKKYPQLDIRVVEMKTNDIKKALQTEEIDAGIVASLAGMEEFRQIPLFYEQFYTYIARENRLFANEIIRTADLTGEQLWMLDEGHCFRDQLERFCQLKAARASQLAYHWAAWKPLCAWWRAVKESLSFQSWQRCNWMIGRKNWCVPLPFPVLPDKSSC